MIIALTRDVSPALADCELTHVPRVPIDIGRAREQHAAYEAALHAMGCHVERLAAGDAMSDSVFIEDTALVLDEVAVITRPGALSRRGEIEATALALQPYRALIHIEPPGCLDGGDILVAGPSIFVGVSGRSNAEAAAQLGEAVSRFGYQVNEVEVHGCLHLKSAVTALDDHTLLVQRAWVDVEPFARFKLVDAAAKELPAANVLRVGERLLAAAGFPRTADLIVARGYELSLVDVSELAKAEGAVTCCSLVFNEDPAATA